MTARCALLATLISGCAALFQAAMTQPMRYEQLAPIVAGPATTRDGRLHIPLRFESDWLQQNSGVAIDRVDATIHADQIQFTVYRTGASGSSGHAEPAIDIPAGAALKEWHLVYVGPDDARTNVGVVRAAPQFP